MTDCVTETRIVKHLLRGFCIQSPAVLGYVAPLPAESASGGFCKLIKCAVHDAVTELIALKADDARAEVFGVLPQTEETLGFLFLQRTPLRIVSILPTLIAVRR